MAIKKITLILAALALACTLTFSLGSDVARAQAGEVDEAGDPARTPVAPVKEGYQEESIEIQDRPGIRSQSIVVTGEAKPKALTPILRIMPLGDSITKGTGTCASPDTYLNCIGYRHDLWDLLVNNGYAVNFVGTQGGIFQYLYNSPYHDNDHEGHGGWTADQIRFNVYGSGENWLNTNPADIILLHIGTNDISGTQAINSIVTEVSQILDKIDQYEAQKGITAWVILARIVNRSDPQSSDGLDTTLFNNQLQTMANNRISSGDKIIVVDMESALNYPGDLSDDKHPNAGGYSKMADVWYNALVNLINLPPSVTNPGDRNAVEGAAFSLDINATDPENDALTYSAINLPAWLSINPSTGLISGVLPNDTASGGPYTITVRATDPGGFPDVRSYNSDDEVFTLTVTNPAPQVTNPGNQNDDEGETVTLQVQASDPDNGDDITFSAANLPKGLSINANTGLISGIPGYNASSGNPYNVSVTATDDDGAFGNTSFTWTINNRNGPPKVTNPGDRTNTEGQSISLQIQASDPDGDELHYIATNMPEGLSIDLQTGLISGMISTLASVGSPYAVTIEVIDDGSPTLSDSITFQWIVKDSNSSPQIVFIPIAVLD